MQPNQQPQNNYPLGDADWITPQSQQASGAVWISREEYDRLRAQETQTFHPDPAVMAEAANKQNNKALQSRRNWQIFLGMLLALGLYLSVAAGAMANFFVVGAIIIFGAISIRDFLNRDRVENVQGVMMHKAPKHNPYKILSIVLLCITVVPVLLMMGFFFLLFSLGGETGS